MYSFATLFNRSTSTLLFLLLKITFIKDNMWTRGEDTQEAADTSPKSNSEDEEGILLGSGTGIAVLIAVGMVFGVTSFVGAGCGTFYFRRWKEKKEKKSHAVKQRDRPCQMEEEKVKDEAKIQGKPEQAKEISMNAGEKEESGLKEPKETTGLQPALQETAAKTLETSTRRDSTGQENEGKKSGTKELSKTTGLEPQVQAEEIRIKEPKKTTTGLEPAVLEIAAKPPVIPRKKHKAGSHVEDWLVKVHLMEHYYQHLPINYKFLNMLERDPNVKRRIDHILHVIQLQFKMRFSGVELDKDTTSEEEKKRKLAEKIRQLLEETGNADQMEGGMPSRSLDTGETQQISQDERKEVQDMERDPETETEAAMARQYLNKLYNECYGLKLPVDEEVLEKIEKYPEAKCRIERIGHIIQQKFGRDAFAHDPVLA